MHKLMPVSFRFVLYRKMYVLVVSKQAEVMTAHQALNVAVVIDGFTVLLCSPSGSLITRTMAGMA